MNCEKSRKAILLYEELSDSERKAADQHLTICKDCAAYLEQIRQHHELVKKTIAAQPTAPHPAWLTEKIMSRIESELRPATSEALAGRWLLSFATWRHALALATALLVFTLVYEYHSSATTYPVKTRRMAGLVTLDSRQILESIQKEKEQPKRDNVFKGLCLQYCQDEQKEMCDACIQRLR